MLLLMSFATCVESRQRDNDGRNSQQEEHRRPNSAADGDQYNAQYRKYQAPMTLARNFMICRQSEKLDGNMEFRAIGLQSVRTFRHLWDYAGSSILYSQEFTQLAIHSSLVWHFSQNLYVYGSFCTS